MTTLRETAPLLCLIGYRGTGKSTVARRVSEQLGWPWRDADVELEQRAGKTIREIFAEDGELVFRDWESAVVQELTSLDRVILALGGGAVLREANRQAIRRGLVIWLQADARLIWERTKADPLSQQRRPNLARGGLQEIEEMLAVRTPLYRQCADQALDTVGKTPEQIAEQIVSLARARFSLKS